MTAYTLNLLDLCFTLYALSLGVPEANPLLRHVPTMIGYKVIIVGVLLWWLSRRRERVARAGLTLCTAVYAAVCTYHIFGLIGGI